MDFSFLLNDIASWREGHVMNDIVFNLGCCCPSQGTEEVFSYIEVVYQNGNRTISMKMKLVLSVLKLIFMRSVSLPSMSSGQQKSLQRKNVICSLSATMYVAQKMLIRILPLLRWKR